MEVWMRWSMGFLEVRGMRKDSAREVSWRYNVGLLYLGYVLRCWFPASDSSLKNPGRQM
jgi:hypothetical protein